MKLYQSTKAKSTQVYREKNFSLCYHSFIYQICPCFHMFYALWQFTMIVYFGAYCCLLQQVYCLVSKTCHDKTYIHFPLLRDARNYQQIKCISSLKLLNLRTKVSGREPKSIIIPTHVQYLIIVITFRFSSFNEILKNVMAYLEHLA